MQLIFNKVIIHNFGSYSHDELELTKKGFCSVTGENKCPKDNAASNGSGKSLIWSAICFALTGETVAGIKTNLKNLNMTDDKSCYVTIDLSVDNHHYIITRYIEPKSDLKIIKDDIDISGKGIMESKNILATELPDLTKDLITSCIIIGQGMPNKFSSFSPSGRKELLEKLTKSDFMIDDIKLRVKNRLTEVSTQLRQYEDSLLVIKTRSSGNATRLTKIKTDLANMVKPDFDTAITSCTNQIVALQTDLEAKTKALAESELLADKLNNDLVAETQNKSAVVMRMLESYNNSTKSILDEKTKLNANRQYVSKEINRIKNIKDTCPTCGHKLENVNKPSTTELEVELQAIETDLEVVNKKLIDAGVKKEEYTKQIDDSFAESLKQINDQYVQTKSTIKTIRDAVMELSQQITVLTEQSNKLNYDKLNWDGAYNKLLNEVAQLEQAIADDTKLSNITEIAKADAEEHKAVLTKMETLTKRDFRGYLLADIIKFIDMKAKDYCQIVFGTRDLNVYLEGNDLNISYAGKLIDNLSGGEKQRVDLILQFVIRTLLNTYLHSTSNILVLDEITDFLDKQSCAAVMRLLELELNTIESVFIISHHIDELEIPIESEVHVLKDELGISHIN